LRRDIAGEQTVYNFDHAACVTAVYLRANPHNYCQGHSSRPAMPVAETKNCAFRVVPQNASGQRYLAVQINKSAA